MADHDYFTQKPKESGNKSHSKVSSFWLAKIYFAEVHLYLFKGKTILKWSFIRIFHE